jgi:hypothetical protein
MIKLGVNFLGVDWLVAHTVLRLVVLRHCVQEFLVQNGVFEIILNRSFLLNRRVKSSVSPKVTPDGAFFGRVCIRSIRSR